MQPKKGRSLSPIAETLNYKAGEAFDLTSAPPTSDAIAGLVGPILGAATLSLFKELPVATFC